MSRKESMKIYIWKEEGKYKYIAFDMRTHTASQGKTVPEAIANILEALELYYEKDINEVANKIEFIILDAEAKAVVKGGETKIQN